jgi:23S rRNA pseudouridine1911/1915/1917 synthase
VNPPRNPSTPTPTPPEPDRIRTVILEVATASTERLDRFLAGQLSLSRTQAARLIADGAVLVNGERARASRTMARGDRLEVTIPERPVAKPLAPHPLDLTVVHEDEVLLVLDKPAGLVVHPAPGHWDDTLVNALVARGTRLSDGMAGRPGIVHRLDRDTSGLLIVAKEERAHRALARALSARRVERVYAALAWGHLDGPVDVDAPVARHPRDRKRMTVLATGRAAQSRVEPVARFETCDLVRVRLATGRTHQIRVHLAHIGHPVVGDPVYAHGGARRLAGQQRRQAEAVEREAPRQALHAAVLRFVHPVSREPCVFRSEWPADLGAALAAASGNPDLLDCRNPLQYLDFFE